jgi:glucose-6-phosphate isomerase
MQSHRHEGTGQILTKSFSLSSGPLTVELGRNYWSEEIRLDVFEQLKHRPLQQVIHKIFQDNRLNIFEDRPVTHVAWRDQNNFFQFRCQAKIQAEKQRNITFATQVISGDYRGFYHERITDVVNIGIGGSHLGNALVCNALKDFHHGALTPHFLIAPDPYALQALLADVDPRKTLWLFNSKSFTTFEMLTLLDTIKAWFLQAHPVAAMEKHFFAITSKVDNACQQGFKPSQIFCFDEGVGGRFSLWSSSGLISLLVLGPKNYEALLGGAHEMDKHVHSNPVDTNISVCLAWLDYYYAHFLGAKARAVVPYTERLSLLPQYLQQLEMESLGKSFLCNETFSDTPIGLIVFGGVGPGSQHAFHQYLYQSEQLIPIDFIAMKKTAVFQNLQDTQLAQCLAQSKALWDGNEQANNRYEKINGRKPSNLIVLDELTPEALGALLALYEHKVYVLGELFQINVFDQFGVEFAKKLAQPLLDALNNLNSTIELDPISKATIQKIKKQ